MRILALDSSGPVSYTHLIPVIIMEPLRGGKLVDLLPEKAKKRIAEDPKKRTPAELAFRWLWEQPEVTCVLSGIDVYKRQL